MYLGSEMYLSPEKHRNISCSVLHNQTQLEGQKTKTYIYTYKYHTATGIHAPKTNN